MKQTTVVAIPHEKQHVVVVDDQDQKLGLADILTAHAKQGIMHRAISVILYKKINNNLEVLLQRRSKEKPLWPLFWTNTVCTHPRDGESYEDCAVRRLYEEMGIVVSPKDLRFVYRLRYAAQFSADLAENELDSVYIGAWDGKPAVNPAEVAGFKWMAWQDVLADTRANPKEYTPWFLQLIHEHTVAQALGESL